MDIRF